MTKTTTNGKITIKDALTFGTDRLSSNTTLDTPRLDAEILMCHILGCERIFLTINKDRILTVDEHQQFNSLIERRYLNEPVSYITNSREFMSLDFSVTNGILIPRPDTEILVETIIEKFKESAVNILDLCTGSGAVGVSLAYYLKKSKIVAVDKYEVCIETAKKNALKNGVDDRIVFLKKDVLEKLEFSEEFDCIVSNPPYVRNEVLATLPKDVLHYEPIYALDGGDDGLLFYRAITEFASKKLRKKGILAFEIGYDQGESVKHIIEKTGCFYNIEVINDLSGLNRVITAEKR